MIRTIFLAGASALAFCATSAEATAVFTDSTPGSTSFMVTHNGTYQIDVYGAQGGTAGFTGGGLGGDGAGIGGNFKLTAGEVVRIDVGGAGKTGNSTGGGGGGSFVTVSSTALIIAGGGGGFAEYTNGQGGQSGPGATGGVGGVGGVSGVGGRGGGGGGGGLGGSGFGGSGGSGGYGGGGFPALSGGGGGGGYSFNSGANQAVLDARYGDGMVTISSVPEPNTWSLMLTGFGLLGYTLRRRSVRAV